MFTIALAHIGTKEVHSRLYLKKFQKSSSQEPIGAARLSTCEFLDHNEVLFRIFK